MVLKDSRLKIDWANKHIADIKARLRLMHESDTAKIEVNPNTGGEILKHDFADTSAFSDIALILGDAVHSLKCALDYAWLQTIERVAPIAVTRFAKFPVWQTVDELENALRGRKIHIASPKLFDLLVSHIKPHSGGNYAIWPLHNLDRRDKHRFLIPVLSAGHITGIEVQDEKGEIFKGNAATAEFQQPPYYVAFERGLHIKNKGKLFAQVIVNDGEAGYPLLVPETISHYLHSVLQIVEVFEGFLETQPSG